MNGPKRRLLALLISTIAFGQGKASISGVVRNAATSDPLPGAKVSVFGAPTPVTADDNGRFQLSGINPGSHSVRVEKEGYTFGGVFDGMNVAVSDGEQVKNLTIRLTPEAVLSGKVVDQSGMPVSASLSLKRASDLGFAGSTISNTKGAFRIGNLLPGEFKLEASPFQPGAAFLPTYYPASATDQSAATIRVSSGEHVANLNIVMQPTRLSVVTGKYTGEIPQQLKAHLQADQGQGRSRKMSGSTLLSPDGSFSLKLPDGDHKLKVVLLRSSDQPMVIGLHNISVAGAPVVDVMIPPAPLRTVRTRIRWATTGRPISPDAYVRFNPLEGNGILQYGKWADNGALEATLSPDRYSVLIGKLPPGTYVKSLTSGNGSIIESGLDLLAGTATDIDAVLSDDGGTVTALVTDASRQPLQGGMLWLDRQETATQAESQFYSRSTACSSQGVCSLTGIAPGEYKAGVRVNQQMTAVQTIRISPNSQQQLQFTVR